MKYFRDISLLFIQIILLWSSILINNNWDKMVGDESKLFNINSLG